jgi:hypothetical protein
MTISKTLMIEERNYARRIEKNIIKKCKRNNSISWPKVITLFPMSSRHSDLKVSSLKREVFKEEEPHGPKKCPSDHPIQPKDDTMHV